VKTRNTKPITASEVEAWIVCLLLGGRLLYEAVSAHFGLHAEPHGVVDWYFLNLAEAFGGLAIFAWPLFYFGRITPPSLH
jgi:hypothetical protein